MKWSFRIATIAGTEVRIHVTFFLLLGFIALQAMSMGGASRAIEAVLFVLAMFTCVLLHEFGHVFAARGYGIQTPDITLLPIGGMARLERMPRKPLHEFVVAICGPLVNVAIAAAIAGFVGVRPFFDPEFPFLQPGHFFEKLMMWNVMMVVFNLIPAFPMDGGRVLRAILAMLTDYSTATRWAATVGQGIAMVVVIAMLLFGVLNPILILIAIFIFMAAGQEAAMVTQQEATRGLLVQDAMLTEFHSLGPDAMLKEAVGHLLAGTQQDFPVLDENGGMLGIIDRTSLIAALSEHGPSYPAQLAIQRCGTTVDPTARLSEAMERLQTSSCPALPVLEPRSGRLIGLLTAENVGETLLVRAALKKARDSAFA